MKLHEAQRIRDELEVAYINNRYRSANGFTGKTGSVSFSMDITTDEDFMFNVRFFGEGFVNFSVTFYGFHEHKDVMALRKFAEKVISGDLLFSEARYDCFAVI